MNRQPAAHVATAGIRAEQVSRKLLFRHVREPGDQAFFIGLDDPFDDPTDGAITLIDSVKVNKSLKDQRRTVCYVGRAFAGWPQLRR